ncbi:MAG: DUF2207 domain-containing protein, partial [Acidimicrobiia bacterium]|nr:DUF2207 domain-containing protein [Acidimicrobiia bacterium]
MKSRRTFLALGTVGFFLLFSWLGVIGADTASAKSFWIDHADVDVTVRDDGALIVTENITFDFSGSFSGAYRDIPIRPGETISDIVVSDAGGPYRLGGCTDLGCFSPAGTYGYVQYLDVVRIVWHHDSTDVARTFTIDYVMEGVATAYADVLDVNLQVWGDQWAVGLDDLDARIHAPGNPTPGEVLVWGHPFGISGATSLGVDGVTPTLEAKDVPAERWVELRGVFPVSVLTSTDGARNVAGAGLDTIRAEEQQFTEDAEAARRASGIGLIVGIAAILGIAGGLGLVTYLRYGREPRVDYDRAYEQEPPTDL